MPVPSVESDRRFARAPAYLATFLQRLEPAEVDGGLDLLRVAADAVGFDGDRAPQTCAPATRARRRVPCRRAAAGRCRGEVAQVLERVGRVGLQLGEHRLGGFAGRRAGERRAQLGLHRRARRAVAARRRGCSARASRRSSSWAVTSRCREARSSSISRTLRSTRPACDATSASSLARRSDVSGSFGGLVTDERAQQLALIADRRTLDARRRTRADASPSIGTGSATGSFR